MGVLTGKSMITFGDSIIDGHLRKKEAFTEFTAKAEGMVHLGNFANNGAKVMPGLPIGEDGIGGFIIDDEIVPASGMGLKPDFIVFNGGTNDAWPEIVPMLGDPATDMENEGTFAGMFTKTIRKMKRCWPEAKLVFVAVHKLYYREWDIQVAMHAVQMAVCEAEGVAVANVFEDSPLDVRDDAQRQMYSFDILDENGMPAPGGVLSGTHPNYAAVEKFYVPVLSETLKKLV